MSAEDKDKATFLLRDVPGDVVRELTARAKRNYRARSNEIIAILTAVCRGQVALPLSLDDAMVEAMSKPSDALSAKIIADGLPMPKSGFQDSVAAKAGKLPKGMKVINDPQPRKIKGGEV